MIFLVRVNLNRNIVYAGVRASFNWEGKVSMIYDGTMISNLLIPGEEIIKVVGEVLTPGIKERQNVTEEESEFLTIK